MNNEKKRLFVDMDGTLARFHDEVNYLERMFEKDFFRDLEPFENMVAGIRQFMKDHPDVEVFVLSARVLSEPPYCEAEKNAWLDEHLPEIDREHRIYTEVGKPKADFIPNGIGKNDYLLDDYNKGLNQWLFDGGSAIKCHNNINQKGLGAYGGSAGRMWAGAMVHTEDTPDLISAEIAQHMELEHDLNKTLSSRPGIHYTEFVAGSRLDPNPFKTGITSYLCKRLESQYNPEYFEATYTSEDFTHRTTMKFSNPLNAIRWLENKSEFQELELQDLNDKILRIPHILADTLASNLYGCQSARELAVAGIFPKDVGSEFRNALDKAKLPVVGQVNYLGTNGKIGETCLFHSVEEMKEELLESLDCGRPVTADWFVQQPKKKEFTLETYDNMDAPEFFTISRDNLALALQECGIEVNNLDDFMENEYLWDDSYLVWDTYAKYFDAVANAISGFVPRQEVEKDFYDLKSTFAMSSATAAVELLERYEKKFLSHPEDEKTLRAMTDVENLIVRFAGKTRRASVGAKSPLDNIISSAQGKQGGPGNHSGGAPTR